MRAASSPSYKTLNKKLKVHVAGPWVAAIAAVACAVAPGDAYSDVLDVRWRTQLSHEPTTLKPREPAEPLLTADGKVAYIGTSTGLAAIAVATGAVLWSHKTREAIVGRPVLADLPTEGTAASWGPTLYAATLGGALLAVHPTTGVLRIENSPNLDVLVHSPLAADSRYVFAFADPSVLLAIDRGSGKPVWRWSAAVDRDYVIEGNAGPLVYGHNLYFGTPTGKLIALSVRDGGLAWDTSLELPARSPYGDVDSTPLMIASRQGPLLVATSHSGGMCAVAPADGRIVWRYTADGLGQPVATSMGIAAVSSLGELHLVGLDGQRRLARKLIGPMAGALAVCAGGLLLAPHETGMDLIRMTDLRTVSRLATEHGFGAAPACSGENVVALTNSGTVVGMIVHAEAGALADPR